MSSAGAACGRGCAREREKLLLPRFQLANTPLGGGQVASGLRRIGHRQRRARPALLVHRTAAIQIRLRQHLGARRSLVALGVDQHDLETLIGALCAQCVGQFEVQAEDRGMQHDRGAERHGEHPIVAAPDPQQSHVPSYFSWTSPS